MVVEDILLENIDFFKTAIAAIGGLFALYVAYLITNFVLNIRRYRHLQEIRYDIDLVKKKLKIKGQYRKQPVAKKHHYYLLVCGMIFGVVAALHFIRAVMGWSMFIENVEIPLSVSWIAFIVLGVMAFLSFRINK